MKIEQNALNRKLENIKEAIKVLIHITDEEWEHYSSMFTIKEFQRKEIILQRDEICNNVYFINKGLIRVYFTASNGDENTFHFSQEGSFVTDYESLMRQCPSNYTLQALENTEVIVMSKEMLHDGFSSLKEGEKLGRLLIEHYFFLFSEKLRSIYTENPIERYQKMNERYPGILSRISQHYIASYLNISSVHLSRIKSNTLI